MKTETVSDDDIHAIAKAYVALREAYPEDDRNGLMVEAWRDVVGREPRLGSDVDAGLATEADVDADLDATERVLARAGEASR